MHPKVSVIIAINNKFKLSKDCLDSLFKTTNRITELIVIDNNSDEKGMKSWFKKLNGKKKGNCKIKVIFNKENVGFLPAINQGVDKARGDILVIINNDLLFPPGAFNNLLDSLLSDPNIGIAAPVTNFSASPQIITSVGKGNYKGRMGYNTYSQMRNWAEKYQRANKGKKYETFHLIGMVMAMRMLLVKELMKKDGFFFDPIFGKGNWEDNDLCRRILYKGLKLVIAGDSYVHHYGHQSWIGTPKKIEEFRNILIENEKIFRTKWDTKKKIIAMVYVQNEDEYLEKCLSHLEEYTDGAVILDNKSTNPKTQEVIEKHRNFIKAVYKNPNGTKEDKERDLGKALQMALSLNPDWIISLNADEVFEEKMAEIVQNLANPLNISIEGYYFPIYSLWKSDKEYRADSNWDKIAGVKMFKNIGKYSGKITQYKYFNHIPYIPEGLNLDKVYESSLRIKKYVHSKDKIPLRGKPLELCFWKEDKSIKPTVSLCMIIKNETTTLRKCLETSKGLWDELIVAWSGTNPKTKKILKEFGAKIIPYKWKNDFADARNTSIKYASKDWILWFDGDEYIEPEIIQKLKQLLKETDYNVIYLTIKIQNKNGEIIDSCHLCRLFRNKIGLHFISEVHEFVKLPRYYARTYSPLYIYHTGYADKNNNKKKLKRNYLILKKAVRYPNNCHMYYYIGKYYFAEKKWKNAIRSFRLFLKPYKNLLHPIVASGFIELAKCYFEINELDKAIKTGYEALSNDNLNADAYLIIGKAYEKKGETDNAILAYETILKIETPAFYHYNFIPDNFYVAPRLALAKLYLAKGDKTKAGKYLHELLKINPYHDEAKKMLSGDLSWGNFSIKKRTD